MAGNVANALISALRRQMRAAFCEFEELTLSSDLCGYLTCMWYADIHAKHTHKVK